MKDHAPFPPTILQLLLDCFSSCRRHLYMVVRPTCIIVAIWSTVTERDSYRRLTSLACFSSSLAGRPPVLPLARAASSPARVLSRIRSRSNWARLSPSNARAQGFSDAGGRHSSVAGGSGSSLLRVGMVLAVSGVFSSSSVPVLSSRMMSVSFHIPIPGPVAGMAPWSMPGSGSGRAFASGKAEAQGSPTCAGWVWLTASGMVVE